MPDLQMLNAINAAVSGVLSVFRGVCDPNDSAEFAMAMLVLKYLADTGQQDSPENKKLASEGRYFVPEEASFYSLHAARNQPGNGARIDKALELIDEANIGLDRKFLFVSFDSPRLGSADQKDRVLWRLLEAFDTPVLDFRADHSGTQETAAAASEAILRLAGEASGRRGGEYLTPPELSQLIALLMQPKHGETIYDPFCGAALTLTTCNQLARQSSSGKGCVLYGQDTNGNTLGLAKMNLLLHGETDYLLAWGDTLRNPSLLEADGELRKFDVVVSHPPFSLREWGHERAENDPFGRYWRGVPPRTSGDFACISHMIASLAPEGGRMAVIVSLGVLFRGGTERKIREHLVKENLIDAVIALPPKMLANTGIATAILVLRRKKSDDGILFIDASRGYQQGKILNVLREPDLNQIATTYKARTNVGQYSKLASQAEVASNDFNLSVARYVQVAEEEEELDLASLRAERAALRSELERLEEKLAILLKEIGHA
ncbi:TPA: N-6 DNA methylase [Pseudomonas aeruginosa]|uniref:N-6 DNA methylase n=1 Tax=Pseudomonas aeruginosa TaxID=287 RepID=UPI00053DEA74|nr:N-6 DNA methylase [Pseudomonas aeruginosa]